MSPERHKTLTAIYIIYINLYLIGGVVINIDWHLFHGGKPLGTHLF
jgi:hypothetical protein